MAQWWYSLNRRTLGPVDEPELKQLLLAGQIHRDTLVWNEEQRDWLPLHAVIVLAHITRGVPPPLPPESSSASHSRHEDDRRTRAFEDAELFLAGRWRRFFARMVDTSGLGVPTAWAVTYSLAMLSDRFAAFTQMFGSDVLIGVAIYPLVLLVEGLFYGVTGTTPGKALLGIKVLNPWGDRPTFAEYLKRLVGVYRQGMGLGVPIVTLCTMLWQSVRLGKGKPATYDEGSFSVVAPKLSWARAAAATVVVLCLFFLNAALTSVGREAQRAQMAGISWTNTVTGRTAHLPPRWNHATQKNEGGQAYDLFYRPSAGLRVVWARESFNVNASLHTYANLWVEAMKDEMRLEFEPNELPLDGYPVVYGFGSMNVDSAKHVYVCVTRRGNDIWRMVVIGARGLETASPDVLEMRRLLFSTL